MRHHYFLLESPICTSTIIIKGARQATTASSSSTIMYPHQSNHIVEKAQISSLPATTSTSAEAAYAGAYEELFGPDADMKAGISAHPLFEQLLAAHVACLRVGTPREEQHIIDSALANRHHVAAKYLALLSHLQSLSHPAHNEDLDHFMVNYILLLQSFKDKILEHLRTEASEAISSCEEIEQELFSLTGATSRLNQTRFSNNAQEDEIKCDEKIDDEIGLGHLAIHAFLPYDIQKILRDHVRRELKQELKKDYHTKLKEVRDEILRKRRAGKLPENTTHFLRDWWISHAKWPYPTEEEKAQLMAETGLDLKQINNWFINQRKRKWQNEKNISEGFNGGSSDSCSTTPRMRLSLNCDQESSYL